MAAPSKAPTPKPRRTGASLWADRLLGLCPLAILILWVAGIALFRGHELQPTEWMVLVVGGFGLHLMSRLTWHRRPLPAMPEGARAVPLAALIATILAVVAAVIGGALELIAENYFPSEVAWGLRTLWHAACAFGAFYTVFLQRLLRVLPA